MLQEAQGHGLDLDGGRAGRFEQAGMKRTQLAAPLVVPSGNRPTASPWRKRACMDSPIACTAWRWPRSMNSVPAPATSQPMTGQLRISLLATKDVARAEFSTKISIQDT